MIGFTQSSYPAYYLPSDEDYKTLSFVISLQRWVKDLEDAKFWLIFSKQFLNVNILPLHGLFTEFINHLTP